MRHFILPLIFTISLCFASTTNEKEIKTVQKKFINSLIKIKTDENGGLEEIKRLIEKDPKVFKKSYLRLFLDPYKSKYKDILKSGYNRYVEILLFKKLSKSNIIDKDMQEFAINYIFFSSYKGFTKKTLPLIELFDNLLHKNLKNNTKENQELLAIFQANYLLSEERDDYAYKILRNNAPYHSKAFQTMRYFSSIKNIPIFKNKKKIEKIFEIKLKEPIFEYNPKFLFDFYGKKYMAKEIE